jgi:ribosome-interacting GTPase 1
MPANLPPEAKAKWNEALAERDPRKKVQAFQEFLSAIPKHKGNEHLRAQIKTKIATLKDEIAAQRGRSGGRSSWTVEREGAAQVMIFGPTNVGRSSLLRALTKAQPTVAEYEFTTQRPIPGMLLFEDIQFQLIELPAPLLNRDGGYDVQPEVTELLRTCDGLLLVFELSSDPVSQFRSIARALEDIRISIRKPSSRVEIVREKGSGEIRIATSGTQIATNPDEIRELLRTYGIKNALIRVYGDVTIEDVEDAILENVTVYKPCIMIGNKLDLAFTKEASLNFEQEIHEHLPLLPVLLTSCLTGQGLPKVGEQIFNCLGLVRVYTKEPNQSKTSDHPFVVREGTTVKELARSIHSDLAERYRYSRIWGPTSKFPGERVGPEHILGDQDIVEIHAE